MIPNEGLNFRVYWLLHNNGDCPTVDHLLSLQSIDPSFFASAVDVISRLQQGRFHKMPWTRPLKGKDAKGLFEARVLGGVRRQMARYPFIYGPERGEIVLLYGFTKDDGDAPPKFVHQANIYKKLIEEGKLNYEQADLSFFQQFK